MARRVLSLVVMFALFGVIFAGSGLAASFHGCWPYPVPPQGHFNTFATNNINLGMYWDLIEQPLAMQYWKTGEFLPLLGESWELIPADAPDTLRVNLRKGVKWHDGSDFTAKDVVGTFYMGYLFNWAVWDYLASVEAVDDFTVDFKMSRPSSVVPRYVLRERIRAASVYGTYYDRLLDYIAAGKDRDSDELKSLRVEFSQFRPRTMVGTGPFTLDPQDMTEAAVDLRRFANYWDPDKIKFDVVRVYNGETPTVTPLIMAKEADFATHGFPPATEMQFKNLGIRIARPPVYSGPAIYFNADIYPLNRLEVRRAVAYAINKDENAQVSLGDSAKRQVYMTGLSDNILPLYTDEEARNSFNDYRYDPAKAEEILESIGFTRGRDGIWVDDRGNKMSYELLVPQEFADWSAAAQNAASQLTNFGIETTVRGITHTQVPQEIWSGRFQLAIQAWGAGNPHPQFSYYQNLVTYNYPSGQGPGMNFPLEQVTESVGEIDLRQAVVETGEGFDTAYQKKMVTRIAKAFNELLPIVPLWERYGNNAVVDGVRVTNWPDDSHMLWVNGPYSDNAVTMMILEGILEPVK